jgi:hypothetical protein
MKIGQFLDESQSQPCSLVLAIEAAIQLHKGLEQSLQIFSSNAHPCIDHGKLDQLLVQVCFHFQGDMTLVVREFNRIGKKVDQDLFETPRVCQDVQNR